jgi:hypothetical protein
MCAVSIKGSRVERNTEVELDPVDAANYGSDLVPVSAPAPEPVPEPEKSLVDMSAAELKVKAEALSLSTSGTKADLLERITLHLEGGEGDED